jgi:plasmid stabilization system protein ParE
MARPVLSFAARRDADQVLDYLSREAGPSVATKYRRSLLHLLDLLTDNPALGAPRPSLVLPFVRK